MLRAMHIEKPRGASRCHLIRWTHFEGDRSRRASLYGYASYGQTARLRDRLTMLIDARGNGEPAPRELRPWINNMQPSFFNRLCDLGLLDPGERVAARPLAEHVDDYEREVASRRSNTAGHARQQAARVRRIVEGCRITSAEQVSASDVRIKLSDWELSAATRRHYLVALQDFCRWMVRDKRLQDNPLDALAMPAAGMDEVRLRRPLTFEQFQTLWESLEHVEYHPHQQARWTGRERRLIYLLAVRTGLRESAIANLRRSDLMLDAEPAQVRSTSRYQKNKREHHVAIGPELAAALAEHVDGFEAGDRVFASAPLPDRWARWLRRDMEAAGLATSWDLGDGRRESIDFHCLRATAIVWLLLSGVPQIKVARIVNLKTLHLVQQYASRYRLSLDDDSHLTAERPVEQAGQPAGVVGSIVRPRKARARAAFL